MVCTHVVRREHILYQNNYGGKEEEGRKESKGVREGGMKSDDRDGGRKREK